MLKHALITASILAVSVPAIAQDAIVVWTGGIGIEERNSAPKDGTKLVFFVETANFLSGVQVSIKDAGGKEIVNAVSKGPWMVLNLSPGHYTVRATVGAQAQGGAIEVTGNRQKFAYMFKAQ